MHIFLPFASALVVGWVNFLNLGETCEVSLKEFQS